jgi:hypothetical protein
MEVRRDEGLRYLIEECADGGISVDGLIIVNYQLIKTGVLVCFTLKFCIF